MATGDLLQKTKAIVGGGIAAFAGLVLPGVTYLLTVDENGITATEWRHAVLLAVASAAGSGLVTGAAVYAVENKPQPGVLLGEARFASDVDPTIPDEL